MTKLERAIKEAEQLPHEMRDQLGEQLLHYIHKYLALRDDLDAAIKELDAGLRLDGKEVFASLKARYGA
jgi:outer membrane lipopolysaccharide assembly protein LptE/RlpB